MPDIVIAGATYPDVPQIDVPKAGGGTVSFYADGGGGGSTCATGTVSVTEALHTLTINTGISLSFFMITLDTATGSFPGYKSFSMLSGNGSRWCALGSNNAGTGGSYQSAGNSTGNGIVFNGKEVTINASGTSGTVLGAIQTGTWRWFAA